MLFVRANETELVVILILAITYSDGNADGGAHYRSGDSRSDSDALYSSAATATRTPELLILLLLLLVFIDGFDALRGDRLFRELVAPAGMRHFLFALASLGIPLPYFLVHFCGLLALPSLLFKFIKELHLVVLLYVMFGATEHVSLQNDALLAGTARNAGIHARERRMHRLGALGRRGCRRDEGRRAVVDNAHGSRRVRLRPIHGRRSHRSIGRIICASGQEKGWTLT